MIAEVMLNKHRMPNLVRKQKKILRKLSFLRHRHVNAKLESKNPNREFCVIRREFQFMDKL